MEITAAVVREKGGKFNLEKVELEEPREDEVLVRIIGAGTCHTDISARNQEAGPTPLPIVLGHEGSGIVEKVGSNVTNLKKGDHVVLTFGFCGECSNCEKDKPAYCEKFAPLNLIGSRLDGSNNHSDQNGDIHDNFFSQSSFGTYSIANKYNTIKVNKEAPLELLGPLGCGIQTGAGAVINSLKVSEGDTIIISGAGAVGLSGLLAAVYCSASKIVVVDINDERLALAKELGATHVINSSKEDVVETFKKIAPKGFDFGFDTTGRNDVINNTLSSLKALGVMGIVGVSPKPLEIQTNKYVVKGITLKGIIEGDSVPSDFIPKMVEMYLEGQFPFDKLIKTYKFEDINKAVEDSEKGKTIKPVILIGNYKN